MKGTHCGNRALRLVARAVVASAVAPAWASAAAAALQLTAVGAKRKPAAPVRAKPRHVTKLTVDTRRLSNTGNNAKRISRATTTIGTIGTTDRVVPGGAPRFGDGAPQPHGPARFGGAGP